MRPETNTFYKQEKEKAARYVGEGLERRDNGEYFSNPSLHNIFFSSSLNIFLIGTLAKVLKNILIKMFTLKLQGPS